LLDRCVLPYPRRVRHDLVGIDNRRAGYMATEHVLASGASRVAMVARGGGAPTVEARIAGFREALIAAGRPLDEHPVVRFDALDAAALPDCDGFMCANDRTAGELMRALLHAGVRIPEDARVAGIDDVEYASLLPVPLTTVHQPCREIGEAAMGAMLDRVRHPGRLARDLLLECRLVVRKSCGLS
jgi:GntR family transcriptional regulator, arabinose operon transcriptional repressor